MKFRFAVLLLVPFLAAPPYATAAESPTAGASAAPPDYRIGVDDVIGVVYWREKDLSADAVVRPDGFISLPLLHDVRALGLTPSELGDRIDALAKAYVGTPDVTVVVKQVNSRRVFITGEVAKPGTYVLNGRITILQLIATAGGLTPYAKQEQIAIVRETGPAPTTFRFNYRKASRLQDLGGNVALLPGDTVVVP